MTSPTFQDRVAVVTGASGRLGRLIARAYEEAGARVAAVIRDPQQARLVPVVQGGRVSAFACDVTDEGSVAQTFDQIATEFGQIDHLVHTVGMWSMSPLLDGSTEDWSRIMDVNLTSSVFCLRAAASIMAAGAGGGIVALASRQGADRGVAGQWAYSAAKAGIVRLVEAAADEWAEHGITVRAVAPSTIVYEGESNAGVAAADLVDLCLACSLPGATVSSGSVVRAYG